MADASAEIVYFYGAIVDFGILNLLAFLGTVTNFINLLVFFRQGFKDEVNISLTAIATWDMIKCACYFAYTINIPLGWVSPAAGITWRTISQMYFINIVSFAGYVSYVLASYVSVERCLCVSMPFTVKSIFTPRFSLLMVSLSTLVVVGLNLVVFFATDIVFIYSPQYNTTIAALKFTNFYHQYETQFSDGVKILRILLTFLPFFVLIFSSGITMYFLQTSSSLIRKAKHTKISTSGLSTKEKQVVKMLLVILGLFIGNLFPRILFYVVQFSLPEFYFGKRLNNVFNLTFSGILVLDFVNHTSNLFVFLTMSTNFRAKFLELFPFSRRFF